MIGPIAAAIVIPRWLYLPSIPFGAGAFGLGDVKLLVGWGCCSVVRAVSGGAVRAVDRRGRAPGAAPGGAPDHAHDRYVPFGPFLIIGAVWASCCPPEGPPGDARTAAHPVILDGAGILGPEPVSSRGSARVWTATHRRASPPQRLARRDNGVLLARVIVARMKDNHSGRGWAWTPRRSRTSRARRRLVFFLLLPALIGGMFAAAPVGPVAGDELSDAIAAQKALQSQVKAQKAEVAALASQQSGLSARIASTAASLDGLNADLASVRAQVAEVVAETAATDAAYAALVEQIQAIDTQLAALVARESTKRTQLAERKDLLAERIRNAYDTDRTSLLETFLSGADFTDVLTEVGYLPRHRRPGQGARGADRPRSGDPRRDP